MCARASNSIKINRAPVLTLWAYTVARRIGLPEDEALVLARHVTGSSAQAKARRLGIAEEHHEAAEHRRAERRDHTETVRLLGRDISVSRRDGKLVADGDAKPSTPASVRSYIQRAFGDRLPEVTAAMDELASSLDPQELNRVGFRLYEAFRPEVPDGVKGWGAKGILELQKIRAAAR